MIYEARIELGVHGYHHAYRSASGGDLNEVRQQLMDLVRRFADELDASQDQHGDLSAYTRPSAGGYHSAPFGVELDTDYTVTLLELYRDGEELGYHTPECRWLRESLQGWPWCPKWSVPAGGQDASVVRD